MCNFCDGSYIETDYHKNGNIDEVFAYVDRKAKEFCIELYINNLQETKLKYHIKYCPICGRKLKEK